MIDYRVRITDYGGKVGAWLRRALVFIGGQGEALPLPASGARERHARLARSANPTRYKVKRGTGDRDVGRPTDATQSRPYQRQSKKGNRDVGAFSSTVIGNLNSVIFFSSTQHPQLNLSSTSPIGRRL